MRAGGEDEEVAVTAAQAQTGGRVKARLVAVLAVLAQLVTAPMPALKSMQCPPGHMQSGGSCTPLVRTPPAAAPRLACPSGYVQKGSACVGVRRR
jgi:hypothetical protein